MSLLFILYSSSRYIRRVPQISGFDRIFVRSPHRKCSALTRRYLVECQVGERIRKPRGKFRPWHVQFEYRSIGRQLHLRLN